jgi:hypothetical protein
MVVRIPLSYHRSGITLWRRDPGRSFVDNWCSPQGATALCNDGCYSFSENADMDETCTLQGSQSRSSTEQARHRLLTGRYRPNQELVESVSSMSLMA